MCVNCLESMCSTCARRAMFLVVANGPRTVAVLRACRRHVDAAREDAARTAGVRPNVTEIPNPRVATGGAR